MSRFDGLELRRLPLADLRMDEDNAKTHDQRQINQLIAGIEDQGFNDPIGVAPHPTEDGKWLIVEGEGRFRALTIMGWAEVDCLMLGHMTREEQRAYAIAHNQIQQITGMDNQAVVEEFARLGITSDNHMSMGFSAEDVLFLPQIASVVPHEDGAPLDLTPGDVAGQTPDDRLAANHDSWASAVSPVYRTTLRFESDTDQQAFYRLIARLRGTYPNASTIADRFDQHIAGLTE